VLEQNTDRVDVCFEHKHTSSALHNQTTHTAVEWSCRPASASLKARTDSGFYSPPNPESK